MTLSSMASLLPFSLPAVGLGLLVAWYAGSTLYHWLRLRHVPGPWLARFSYLWLARVSYGGQTYTKYLDLDKRYGSMVRIGPNDVLTSDADVFRRISAAQGDYAKGEWVKGGRLNPYTPTLFMERDPHAHDAYKARLAPAYSGRETPALEAAVDEQVRQLVGLLRRKYAGADEDGGGGFTPCSLVGVLGHFTLDVISKIALGAEFGCLAADADVVGLYATVGDILPIYNLSADIPWVRAVVYSPLFLRLFGPRETDALGIGRMMKITNDFVRSRFEEKDNPTQDMLVRRSLDSFPLCFPGPSRSNPLTHHQRHAGLLHTPRPHAGAVRSRGALHVRGGVRHDGLGPADDAVPRGGVPAGVRAAQGGDRGGGAVGAGAGGRRHRHLAGRGPGPAVPAGRRVRGPAGAARDHGPAGQDGAARRRHHSRRPPARRHQRRLQLRRPPARPRPLRPRRRRLPPRALPGPRRPRRPRPRRHAPRRRAQLWLRPLHVRRQARGVHGAQQSPVRAHAPLRLAAPGPAEPAPDGKLQPLPRFGSAHARHGGCAAVGRSLSQTRAGVAPPSERHVGQEGRGTCLGQEMGWGDFRSREYYAASHFVPVPPACCAGHLLLR